MAAFWVVLHHMRPPVTPFTFNLLPEAVSKMGFAGVDLFFVISGLIMAQTTRNTPGGIRPALRFLAQRFARIYIGWWPFFVLYLLAAWKLGRLRPEVDLWGSFFLWPQDLMQNLLPITWTLSFELYFYVVVAALVAWRRSHAAVVLGVCGITVVALNIWFYQRGLYLPTNEALAKSSLLVPFYLSPLVLEFIAGFLLAEWFHRRPQQKLGYWLAGAAVTFFVAYRYQSTLTSGMEGFFHVGERAVLLGGFACCMVACAMELDRRKKAPWAILSNLGDASYSIYLAHIMVLAAISVLFVKVQPILHWPSAIWALLAMALTLGASWINYCWVEQPLNSRLKVKLARLQWLNPRSAQLN